MGLLPTPLDGRLLAVAGATVRVEDATGVVVHPQDQPCILTAHHVVRESGPQIEIRWPGGLGTSRVLKADRESDLALLDCPPSLRVAPLEVVGDAREVAVGDEVWIFGFPTGWDDDTPVCSRGVLGGVGQETWVNADGTWGNSGGPVVIRTETGFEIVGVVLGRGGAIDRALAKTSSQLRGTVDQLAPLAKRGGVAIEGVNFGSFAAFTADALRVTCEFIEGHFRSGFVRVAPPVDISALLHG